MVATLNLRRVITTDEEGFKHAYHVPPDVPDEKAEEYFPYDPPDLRQMDWDEMIKKLHNLLLDRGFFTYQDIQSMDGLNNAVGAIITPEIVSYYKTQEVHYE